MGTKTCKYCGFTYDQTDPPVKFCPNCGKCQCYEE